MKKIKKRRIRIFRVCLVVLILLLFSVATYMAIKAFVNHDKVLPTTSLTYEIPMQKEMEKKLHRNYYVILLYDIAFY